MFPNRRSDDEASTAPNRPPAAYDVAACQSAMVVIRSRWHMSTRARSISRSQRRSEFDIPNRPVHEIFDSGRSLHAAELAAPNIASGPILDYGFGTGEFAAKLRALTAAPIHACDMSFDLMGAAARNSASINYFLVEDPERPHLPFPHGFFRTIFLLDVLEHV